MMLIRDGYVTNSSSTSFIILSQDAELTEDFFHRVGIENSETFNIQDFIYRFNINKKGVDYSDILEIGPELELIFPEITSSLERLPCSEFYGYSDADAIEGEVVDPYAVYLQLVKRGYTLSTTTFDGGRYDFGVNSVKKNSITKEMVVVVSNH